MTTKLFSFFDDATGVLTTQPAPYIEDGWYIETNPDGSFTVLKFHCMVVKILNKVNSLRLNWLMNLLSLT